MDGIVKVIQKPKWVPPFGRAHVFKNPFTGTYYIVVPRGKYKKDSPRYKVMINHEMVHLNRIIYLYKGNFWAWIIKYILSPSFRLEEEAVAFAHNIRYRENVIISNISALYYYMGVLKKQYHLWGVAPLKIKERLLAYLDTVPEDAYKEYSENN